MSTYKNLIELRDALNAGTHEGDVTSLPTFGGTEPADTTGIYSWDAVGLLRHDADRGYFIEAR